MPSSKPVLGVNDLQSQFPDIAAEAYGWNPSEVTAGSGKRKEWKCDKGHIYNSTVNNRTNPNGRTGCPFCSGRQVLVGFNDLQTRYPDIAAEAYGWEPSMIMPGTHIKKGWKCNEGHIYSSTVSSRTNTGSGCPICDGKQVLVGFNDLKSKFPEIAAEAYGWDPEKLTAGTPKKMHWECRKGHIYFTSIAHRTSRLDGCPFCSGRQVLPGFNDLKTRFPEIASEAYEWDPSTVVAGTHQKKDWKCKEGHIYSSAVVDRASNGNGCSVCSGHQVLAGFNDLKTRFPDIAAEAYGWDPTTLTKASDKKKEWKCYKGHIYNSTVNNRTNGKGCPICAEYGFNQDKDAWFYLMERPGEQQLGVTNDLHTRLKTHERNGWNLIEHTSVPSRGQKVLDTENAFKKWLKKEIGLIKGTTENWATTSMEVQSLAELKARSGIETDLF